LVPPLGGDDISQFHVLAPFFFFVSRFIRGFAHHVSLTFTLHMRSSPAFYRVLSLAPLSLDPVVCPLRNHPPNVFVGLWVVISPAFLLNFFFRSTLPAAPTAGGRNTPFVHHVPSCDFVPRGFFVLLSRAHCVGFSS